MAEIKFEDEAACKNAISEVRNDKNATDWVIISYAGTSGAQIHTLKLLKTGSGGLDELKSHLKDDIVGWCLLRTTDQIDDSVTVKFVFINWVGANIPRMQRARISIHYGGMKSFIGPSHIDITASSQDEITSETLAQKVMDTSGSGSRVINQQTGQKNLSSQATSRASTGTKASVGKHSGVEFGFEDEEGLRAVLAEIRSHNTGINWVLTTYRDNESNIVVLLGKGSGGIDELKQHLKDNIVCYGLTRFEEKIDDSITTKFVMIKWQGTNIPRMLKARIGVHRGDLNKFFHPFHVDLECEHMNEISEEIIMSKINAASGTKINVLNNPSSQPRSHGGSGGQHHSETGSSVSYKPKGAPSSSKPKTAQENVEILFEDEQAIRTAIQSVRRDDDDTNWCVVTYNAPKSKTLKLLAKGVDGLDGLKNALADNIVGYCLLRTTEQIDHSTTVKFVFINWIGTKIDRMQRAVLGTHKGAVSSLFHPFHVDLVPERQDELTEHLIQSLIKKAAGTAVYVL
eukprot:TRINITY_DN6474_c0_g1_i1.p1 TRINITY_DN6474_c0_g1~~TRINITY_DN6474_c0_g1_i1.p1  ORF type:complete len:530 (+),score=95.95 TRINITY_DN6474_c0_g1_i1:51-1592(+)